jgi:hypothetical protein
MEGSQQILERITTAGVLCLAGRYFVAKRKAGGAVGGLWEFPGVTRSIIIPACFS